MDYRKLENADIPVGVVVQLYDTYYDSIKFAERDRSGKQIKICEAYVRKRLIGWEQHERYEEYKQKSGKTIFWAPIETPTKTGSMPWLKKRESALTYATALLKNYQVSLDNEIQYRNDNSYALADPEGLEKATAERKDVVKCLRVLSGL